MEDELGMVKDIIFISVLPYSVKCLPQIHSTVDQFSFLSSSSSWEVTKRAAARKKGGKLSCALGLEYLPSQVGENETAC